MCDVPQSMQYCLTCLQDPEQHDDKSDDAVSKRRVCAATHEYECQAYETKEHPSNLYCMRHIQHQESCADSRWLLLDLQHHASIV